MQKHIFREYDIRGIVGSELNVENVYSFARSLAYYMRRKEPQLQLVAVGMDGRTHSPAIKDELVRGLQDSGIDVLFIGMCPTPVMYFSLHTLPVDAGVMITASHNPAEYNGIKMCIGKVSVFGKQVAELRDLFFAGKQLNASRQGTYTECDVVSLYVQWLADNFKNLHNMPLRAIVDCGNAVGGIVLPRLIEAFGWKQVELLYPEVDGSYPNHEADPSVAKNMEDLKKKLQSGTYDVGIGLDGDCDRMGAMTHDGELIPGDQLLAIFSKPILKNNPGRSVVFDVKASTALVDLITRWGGQPRFSPCGHAMIKRAMAETEALVGGELSCHFCFKDRYFGFDDGVYAALRLFELLLESDKSLKDMLATFPQTVHSPEIRISCDEQAKQNVVDTVKKFFTAREDVNLITIDGIRAAMPYGWGLVRASNTQPMISMRFEASSQEDLKRLKDEFAVALKPFFDEALLDHMLRG
ncbi:phosphomannomutase/phosphoglucomutase [Candidatus Babeliales bacterium]|nr:phosphomannomutase/phosphoglucomutase [Candidatus Babeliales bacterium]